MPLDGSCKPSPAARPLIGVVARLGHRLEVARQKRGSILGWHKETHLARNAGIIGRRPPGDE